MKLHNKKTNEHGDYLITTEGDVLKIINYYDDDEYYLYESLFEFNEDWEEDIYPLIKNEKLKEIFREWDELYEKPGYEVNHYNHEQTTLFKCTNGFEACIELPGCFGEPGEFYTSKQIIGDKE